MVIAMVGAALTPTMLSSASAASGDVGYADFQYGTPYTGSDPNVSPTASKPQSKLWFSQGQWWGALLQASSQKFHIYSYDAATNKFTDTGVPADNRAGVDQVDVLYSDGTLFVVGHSRTNSAVPIQVSEFTNSNGRWVPGPIHSVNTVAVEAAVLAKDTQGRLWVAYTSGGQVRVKVSGTDHNFTTPYFIPGDPATANGDATKVTTDDIASVQSHDGKITVVWSNQHADADGNTAVYVATHPDSADPQSGWEASERIFSGPKFADDHINIQSTEGSPGGSVFVLLKTGEVATDPPANPLIVLMVLRPSGKWEAPHTVATVGDHMTRPIILLEPSANKLHVFASSPDTGVHTGGVIYQKTSPMDNISFPSGLGDPFIKLAADPKINNATSTKQNLTSASGTLVLASDQTTAWYVHNYVPGTGTATAPVADFSYLPASKTDPMKVAFTNRSTNTSSWTWSFGDGSPDVTTKDAVHTFKAPGSYTVTLKASNGTETATKTTSVTVAKAPVAPIVFMKGAGSFTSMNLTVRASWAPSPDSAPIARYRVTKTTIGATKRSRWASTTVATGKRAISFRGKQGSTYCMKVSAVSRTGVVGRASALRCVTVPIDDRQLVRRGAWQMTSLRGTYLGTALKTSSRGASVTKTVTGKTVALLVGKLPRGGRVAVYRGHRLVKRISLKSPTFRPRQLVMVSDGRRVTTARYRVVVTSKGAPVIIDALAVSRM